MIGEKRIRFPEVHLQAVGCSQDVQVIPDHSTAERASLSEDGPEKHCHQWPTVQFAGVAIDDSMRMCKVVLQERGGQHGEDDSRRDASAELD